MTVILAYLELNKYFLPKNHILMLDWILDRLAIPDIKVNRFIKNYKVHYN